MASRIIFDPGGLRICPECPLQQVIQNDPVMTDGYLCNRDSTLERVIEGHSPPDPRGVAMAGTRRTLELTNECTKRIVEGNCSLVVTIKAVE